MKMNERLKKERERLDVTQAFIADLFGISTQAVSKWEKSGTIPIEKIAVLAGYGFDIQYIITGIRSSNLNQVQELNQDDSYDARISKLTETQQDIIKMMIEEMEDKVDRQQFVKGLVKQIEENGKNGRKR